MGGGMECVRGEEGARGGGPRGSGYNMGRGGGINRIQQAYEECMPSLLLALGPVEASVDCGRCASFCPLARWCGRVWGHKGIGDGMEADAHGRRSPLAGIGTTDEAAHLATARPLK